MRTDLDRAIKQASDESPKAASALRGDPWRTVMSDIDEMLPPDERVLYLRWGARSGTFTSGYGILLVTTGRVLFNDTLNGSSVRISDIVAYSGDRGMNWPDSRNSYVRLTARGSEHVFYFERDKAAGALVARAIGRAKMAE
jgi:hypothetical protein